MINHKVVTTSLKNLEITSYDSRWLTQLCKTLERDIFTGHNVFIWNSYIERILKPRNRMHHLYEEGPLATNLKCFQRVNAYFFSLVGYWIQ